MVVGDNLAEGVGLKTQVGSRSPLVQTPSHQDKQIDFQTSTFYLTPSMHGNPMVIHFPSSVLACAENYSIAMIFPNCRYYSQRLLSFLPPLGS
jgi:hypothetical protein